MQIGELSHAIGVTSQTIRFYEREGLLPTPRRTSNGYRDYDESSANRLLFIRGAQSAGLTLAEIASVIDLREEGQAPCTHVVALLGAKLESVRARQAELRMLEAELDRLVARSRILDPAECSDASICHILGAAQQEQRDN